MFEDDGSDGGDRDGSGDMPLPPAGPGLSGLAVMPPGPELAALLGAVDPALVDSAYELVEVAAACQRVKGWADAIQLEAAAALAGHPICHAPEAARRGFGPTRAAGQLLAPRLGMAPATGADRVATAAQLVAELPDTVAALHRGEIDYPKAAALATGVRALDPPDAAQDRYSGEAITADGIRRGLVALVEARVLPRAGGRSLRQHRDAVARAVASVAPRTAEERHRLAVEGRRVDHHPAGDGMAWLGVYGPAADLTAVKVMLDAAAHAIKTTDPGDERTLDQLRVDVLAQLAWDALETGHLPSHCHRAGDSCGGNSNGHSGEGAGHGRHSHGHGEGGEGHRDHGSGGAGHGDNCDGNAGGGCGERGRRLGRRQGRAAAVQVTVPISSLLGVDDAPGELAGYGPVPASVARRIAAHGTWRRLLTDPATGALLDYGSTRYTPPQDLVDHVITRDRSCRFPTCSLPARLCQIDHTTPAGTPGWTTSPAGTGALSAGCHNGKTHAGWRLDQPEPGLFVWTAPTGHQYRVDPETIGPILDHPDTRGHPAEPDMVPEHDPPPY